MEIQDSFLLDEVRCGFLIPAAVKQAWAAELEVLAEIDRVCKKHNIQYFADWGTLLGTVRHGGYIPWDDDLDIVMKREDYNKFMTIARFDMEEGFDVQTFRNHEDCWLFMGKVVGRNRFFFEKEHLRRFHNFPYIASVDVFVLDYVHRDPEKEEKRRTLCKYMLGVANAIVEGRDTPEEKERNLKIVESMYGKKIRRIENPMDMGRYLYSEIEKIFAEVPEQEADYLTQLFPWGLKGNAFQFPKEYYEQSVYLPFECTYMPVPLLYDKLLRQRYGDYWKLVKDAGAHDYPFFEGQKKNLQKVLDFALPEFSIESSKIFRNEEEQAYRSLSYKVLSKECVCELWKMKEQLVEAIEQKHIEQIIDLLQTSQQLAIDFGTMLDPIQGEEGTMIPLLEQYCEELYMIFEQIQQDVNMIEGSAESICSKKITTMCDRLSGIQRDISTELETNILGRKAVMFLPVLAKDWVGLQSLWQAAVSDSNCDVYVVPLPYFYKDYDGSPRKVCCDAADFPKELHVLDYKHMTAEYMEMLHPEVIIIQNPYDSWNPAISVPEMFYSENIRKYTDKLVYVPPFAIEEYTKENEREYFNMKYYVTMPGVVYADYIIVQSESMKRMYIEKLVEFAGKETEDIWEQRVVNSGLSVKDQEKKALCKRKSNKTNQKKKMLYGVSLGAYMEDIKVAREKIERSLQIFAENKEQIELTILIFPDNNDGGGIRQDIMKLMEGYQGMILTEGVKCFVEEYDAYYGDAMPIVIKFLQAGKWVMIQDYELLEV